MTSKGFGLPKERAPTSGKSVDELSTISSQEGEIRGNEKRTSYQCFKQNGGSGTQENQGIKY